MATKKVTKKAVAKKSPAKKVATKKVAAPKKSAAKKVVAKKPVAKKAVTAKPVAKKAAAKKATTARPVKKATAKRAVTKKAATPKRTVKSVSSTPIARSSARIQSVPEVPIRSAAAVTQASNSVAVKPARNIEAPRATEALYEKGPRQEKSSKGSKRDRALLLISALIIVLAGIVAFAVPSSNEKSVADGSAAPVAQPSETPSPAVSESADSMSDGSESAEGGSSSVSNTFSLRYSYNSIGITLNMQAAQSLGTVKEYVVLISENGGASQILGTYSGSTSSVRIAKIDTVGKTSFTVEATLSDGSKVTSRSLDIRGLFAAE